MCLILRCLADAETDTDMTLLFVHQTPVLCILLGCCYYDRQGWRLALAFESIKLSGLHALSSYAMLRFKGCICRASKKGGTAKHG